MSVNLRVDPPCQVLSDLDLRRLLQHIEAKTPRSSPLTVSCGPFAVFTVEQTESRLEWNDSYYYESTPTLCSANVQTVAVSESRVVQHHPNILIDDFPRFPSHSPAPVSSTSSQVETLLSTPGGGFEPASRNHNSPAESRVSIASQSLRISSQSPDSHDGPPCPTPVNLSQLQSQVDYLMHHYETNIINLMTFVETSKGPWKTVHLPRALQGCGELAFRGTTSHSRNALLHALLAISSYDLAANPMVTVQSSDAPDWREIALRHTTWSLTYLKACLHADCPVLEKGKYKEILAVMTSMIIIDVLQSMCLEVQSV